MLSAARSSSVVSTKTGKEYKVKEVGLLTPSVHPVERLHPGQVGEQELALTSSTSSKDITSPNQLKPALTK